MVDAEKISFVKLGSENYATWKPKMRSVLIVKGLWDPVIGTVTDDARGRAKDAQALALITLYVEDHHLSTLEECDTSQEAWEKLEEIFKAKSLAKRLQHCRALTTLKLKNGESLTTYISRAKGIRDELMAAGYDVKTDEIVLSVLAGLPKEFDAVVTMLEGAGDELTLDDVMARLLPVAERLKMAEGEGHSAYMAGVKKCWTCNEVGHTAAQCKKKVQCYGCKEYGHIRRDCKKNPPNRPPVALVSEVMPF